MSGWYDSRVHVARDGTPSEGAVEAFTNGDCWALAIEIASMTDWDLVTLGATMDHDDEWAHCAVLTPEGYVLDIEGLHHPEAALAQWGGELIDTEVSIIKDQIDCGTQYVSWDTVRNVAIVLLWNLQLYSPVQASALVV